LETTRTGSSTWQILPRHADDAVVAWRGRDSFTARDLLVQAKRLAALLQPASGEDEALILCADRYGFAASALAAWSAGYSIALPPNSRPRTVREITSHGRIQVLLHDGAGEWGIDVRAALTDPPSASDVLLERFWLSSDRRIATLYTSGSTGDGIPCPKAAYQLLGEAALLGTTLGIAPWDRILATVPAQHIYGLLMGILVPLSQGASIVCGAPLHAESIAACAAEADATVLAGVPAHLRALASLGDAELGRIRLIVSSSAPLEPEVGRQLGRFSARTVELLGSTETGGIAWRQPPEDLWRPLPGVSVSANNKGNLLVDSPFLAPRAVRPHVGADRIEMNEDGLFRHLGRLDGVLKIAGKRVVLNEMERRLRAIEGVEDAALTAIPASGGRGHEIWAMVVAPRLGAEAIRKGLLSWFDPVVLPRRFRWLDKIPREATGKLPLRRWKEIFGDQAVANRSEFQVTSRSSTDEGETQQCEVNLIVPNDLDYFMGHFEGFPILSGVVILNNLVLAECQRAWPDLPGLRRVSRLKFRRPIHPGAALSLRLVRQKRSIDFELASAGKSCNSGTLTFEQQH
jgi:acyl-coenzyme A synthetase/AMP-(fatty) acid ligase/3-hydroxymyristoyl/3-hydroxydecanoyl-(acyl carrier protein) dehydratase